MKHLKKAKENKPIIQKGTAIPARIVELISDPSCLDGISVKTSKTELSNLSSYGRKRDDKLILDFVDHRVGSFEMDIDQVGFPMDAPLFLRIKFAKVPSELAAESSDYDGYLSRSWIQEEFVHLDRLPARLTLPRRYSFRYVELKIIDTSPKWQAVFSNPVVTTETSADTSSFTPLSLKDEILQQIYNVGLKTLADCMQIVCYRK